MSELITRHWSHSVITLTLLTPVPGAGEGEAGRESPGTQLSRDSRVSRVVCDDLIQRIL